MKNQYLFALWGALFILCAGLGFIPEPAGALRILLTGLSALFFLPPAVLVWKGHRERNRRQLALVRDLSIVSLSLSVLLLIANFLSAFHSELLGNILHGVLVVVSSPMICSGHWALSLFLWACLLIGSLKR
ncbi:MAG: hypothetical protein MR913_00220 [Clostridiales bacterium]|nr:hypothetical protein [Clostridiales bacterium]